MNNSNVYKLPIKFKCSLSEDEERFVPGILMVIAMESNPDTGELIIANHDFKSFIDCSNPIFKKVLNFLIEKGLILRTIRPGMRNIYKLKDYPNGPNKSMQA